ncbi:TetR/AcrR family transcriptional regulator [Bifidobacterium choloepi]|uniref:TetR/AcrR family transcriptional regulator n=1 Tax=Bifidobacterium choloepi TaxID=2614131 RepID=A0A6I5N051_9BIFI|nr:hypothetical protein [Bifidobacterium choloepi]NEG69866.1 hypothetical protein [Bifidobacterium choloepi]
MKDDESSFSGSSANPYADALPRPMPDRTPARAAMEDALVQWMTGSGRRPGELTVSDLCRRAFVARSTFYANYARVEDVLGAVEERLIRELAAAGRAMEDLSRGGDGVLESYDAFVAVLKTNLGTFHLLLIQTPDVQFIERWKRLLEYHFWQRLFSRGSTGDEIRRHDRPSTVNRALVLEMIASAFIAGVRLWLVDEEQVGTAELKALILRLIHDIDEVW